MKNIQVYPAPKYKQPIYTEVEPNIYAYTAKKEDTENCLSLCQVGAPAAMSTAASTVSTANLRVVCMADSSLSAC